MLKTNDIDLRALLDQLEQPLIEVTDVLDPTPAVDDFDGVCTQHDSCRII
jgi:hypothetical protein